MFPSNTRTATNRRNVNHQQSQFHFGLEKKGEKFICVCVSSEREGWMSNNERKRKERKKKELLVGFPFLKFVGGWPPGGSAAIAGCVPVTDFRVVGGEEKPNFITINSTGNVYILKLLGECSLFRFFFIGFLSAVSVTLRRWGAEFQFSAVDSSFNMGILLLLLRLLLLCLS